MEFSRAVVPWTVPALKYSFQWEGRYCSSVPGVGAGRCTSQSISGAATPALVRAQPEQSTRVPRPDLVLQLFVEVRAQDGVGCIEIPVRIIGREEQPIG